MDPHQTTTANSMQTHMTGLSPETLQSLLAAHMAPPYNRYPNAAPMPPYSDSALASHLAMQVAQQSLPMAQQPYNLLHQLMQQAQQQHETTQLNVMQPQEPPRSVAPEPPRQTVSRGRPAKSSDTANRGTNSYASRHQQAEARRRMRINERLDALRRIVPHTERANTAVFLEDVVRYVQGLQARVFELETKLGLPASVAPLPVAINFGENGTPEGTAATGASSMERLAIQTALQQAAAAMASAELAQQLSVQGAVANMRQASQSQLAPLSAAEEMAMAKELAAPSSAAAPVMAESSPSDKPEDGTAAASAPGEDANGALKKQIGDAAGDGKNATVEVKDEEKTRKRQKVSAEQDA